MDYKPRVETDYIVIHCSATKVTMDIGEDEIRAWHIERGWVDIGYNIVIRRDGRVEIARPLDYRGAHVRGFNSIAVGVCLVGGVNSTNQPEDNFTPDQWVSLELTLRWLRLVWPDAEIVGHNELTTKKACPSFSVPEWLDTVTLTNA
jgi:hypothetical protein